MRNLVEKNKTKKQKQKQKQKLKLNKNNIFASNRNNFSNYQLFTKKRFLKKYYEHRIITKSRPTRYPIFG